jgi:multisubunit Na+/H+ antiporter MnhB subunit
LSNTPTPTLPGEHRIVDTSRWSIVNLILSVIGVILAIVMALWVLLFGKKKTNDVAAGGSRRYLALWLIIAVILSIVSLVVFFLTQDLSVPFGWVTDKWTIVHVVILVVELVIVYIGIKELKKTSQ